MTIHLKMILTSYILDKLEIPLFTFKRLDQFSANIVKNTDGKHFLYHSKEFTRLGITIILIRYKILILSRNVADVSILMITFAPTH